MHALGRIPAAIAGLTLVLAIAGCGSSASSAAGALVTVETRGGECVAARVARRSSSIATEPVHAPTKPPNDLGTVPPAQLRTLSTLIARPTSRPSRPAVHRPVPDRVRRPGGRRSEFAAPSGPQHIADLPGRGRLRATTVHRLVDGARSVHRHPDDVGRSVQSGLADVRDAGRRARRSSGRETTTQTTPKTRRGQDEAGDPRPARSTTRPAMAVTRPPTSDIARRDQIRPSLDDRQRSRRPDDRDRIPDDGLGEASRDGDRKRSRRPIRRSSRSPRAAERTRWRRRSRRRSPVQSQHAAITPSAPSPAMAPIQRPVAMIGTRDISRVLPATLS